MTLTVEARDSSVRLVAIGEDGSRAERVVADPASLAPIALGLVLSIPPDPEPREAKAPPASAAAPAPLAPGKAPPEGGRAAEWGQPAGAAALQPAREVQAWLGASVGGRLSAPVAISMADVEGRADVLLDQWLLFAAFRYVPLGLASAQGVDSDVYREIAVSLGAGRRVHLGGNALLDAGVAPSLVAMRMETDRVAGDEGADQVANDIELRVGASFRLAVPVARRWAVTVTADADVAPGSVAAQRRVGSMPPFPTWTGGLRVGASGALL